jgi:hypothetical protein
MGYSCTVDARDTLAVVYKMFARPQETSVLLIKGDRYFFERGQENADGAITGSLYKMLPGDHCRKAGRVRINDNGSITSFPGLTKDEREEAENTMRDMQARNPHLLHAWGMGKL